MSKKLYVPDFIFESSWEVCNKVGGIYTVLSTRAKTLQNEFPDKIDTGEEEQVRLAERDARLWTAIDHLPPERRRIFLLSKRDGLKYQEIAEELHISVKTVENQISKALKALRETAIRIYTFLFLN